MDTTHMAYTDMTFMEMTLSKNNTMSERHNSRVAIGECLLPRCALIARYVSVVVCFVAFPATAQSQENRPAPPTGLVVKEHPNDTGKSIDIAWQPSPDDSPDSNTPILSYRISRKSEGETEFHQITEPPAGVVSFVDPNCERNKAYYYQIVAVGSDGTTSTPLESTKAVRPIMQWFDGRRPWFLLWLSTVCAAILYFIHRASRGHHLKIRKMPGLDAIEEAVGRATEMGTACLFVPGIEDINQLETVAGITILGHVAEVVATYDAQIKVPTARSLTMTAARETVEASYLRAGRPEAYSNDDIFYVTDEQFAYVASVTGYMKREKPAACFYFGQFYAESLILAETGNAIGAMQVAGTAQVSQLPFFVAACDYTLIGEEFFAASAYLSGDPNQLGSLKGQDVGKAIGAALLLFGCLLATYVELVPEQSPMKRAAVSTLNYFTQVVLK